MKYTNRSLIRYCGVIAFTACLWILLSSYCNIASNGDWTVATLLITVAIMASPLSWFIPTILKMKALIRSDRILTQETSYWRTFLAATRWMTPFTLMASIMVGLVLGALGGGGLRWESAVSASLLTFLVLMVPTSMLILLFVAPLHLWSKQDIEKARREHSWKMRSESISE